MAGKLIRRSLETDVIATGRLRLQDLVKRERSKAGKFDEVLPLKGRLE